MARCHLRSSRGWRGGIQRLQQQLTAGQGPGRPAGFEHHHAGGLGDQGRAVQVTAGLQLVALQQRHPAPALGRQIQPCGVCVPIGLWMGLRCWLRPGPGPERMLDPDFGVSDLVSDLVSASDRPEGWPGLLRSRSRGPALAGCAEPRPLTTSSSSSSTIRGRSEASLSRRWPCRRARSRSAVGGRR